MSQLRSPFSLAFGRTEANELSSVLKALAEPSRLLIVAALAQRSGLTVTELTPLAVVSHAAVSKHLQVLQSAGLVVKTKRGAEAPRALNRAQFATLAQVLSPGGAS